MDTRTGSSLLSGRRWARRIGWLALTLAVAPATGGGARAQEALGSQLQVNSYTPGSQGRAQVAAAPDGRFVVVWESYGSPADDDQDLSVQGRLFAADGTPSGAQFQVNVGTGDAQNYPDVAMSSDGSFVVVWTSYTSSGDDTSESSIQARRFDGAGSPLSGDFQVNTYTTEVQYRARVGMDSDGEFVVTWLSYGSGGDDAYGYSVQGQRFLAGGTPLGSQFQINTATDEGEYFAELGVGAGGEFTVAWEAAVTSDQVRVRAFDDTGAGLGDEFEVSSDPATQQSFPAVATQSNGGFIVAWMSLTPIEGDDSGQSVQARAFNAAAAPLVDDFQVNSYTTGGQLIPAVAVGESGALTVAWVSLGSSADDDDGFSVQGRRFAPDGQPISAEFQLNTFTAGNQIRPAVAAWAFDRFVAAWTSDGSPGDDSDGSSIQARRNAELPIFADGFESGDTSAWSLTVP